MALSICERDDMARTPIVFQRVPCVVRDADQTCALHVFGAGALVAQFGFYEGQQQRVL